MNKTIKINKNKFIGSGYPCFIIAEAGVNHDGDLSKAKELIDVAIDAKADAVKFQMFSTEEYASDDAFLATYHKKGLKNKNETIKELLKRLELSKKQFIELCKYAKKRKILIFSTAFDEDNANFLFKNGVDLFKIASFSLTNFQLIENIAKKKLPTIMSTGLHNLSEIEFAYDIFNKFNKNLILLQCTSHYPIKSEDSNLLVMNTLKNAFNCEIGFSDHTMGINVSLAAVALGAKVIEKHYTIETSSYGVDHDASLSPDELKKLVDGIREVESAMGTSRKIIPEIEKEIQKVHRPSLISNKIIKKGSIISKNMISIKKPGIGINPMQIGWVIGRKTKNKIDKNKLILKKDLI
jgi:N,N'-diacetyllegionaminate synthase